MEVFLHKGIATNPIFSLQIDDLKKKNLNIPFVVVVYQTRNFQVYYIFNILL